jgi:hypothetical protein
MIAMKPEKTTLLGRLTQADVVCRDCGSKYGKYSVGCSSMWEGTCDVCGETKAITEVRDWGYLGKGINELNAKRPAQPFSDLTKDFTPERKAKIKEQSAKVANYMASVGPIMNDAELEDCLTASYEQGEITCKFTEEELTALAEVLNAHEEEHPPGWNVDYDSAFEKVMELYGDHCVKYELSPALRKYNEIYGTWGHENDEEQKRWDIFREAFVAGASLNKEGVQ